MLVGSIASQMMFDPAPAPAGACADCPRHPGSPGDLILLVFAMAGVVAILFANAVIIMYRRRSYFRAQGGVDLILATSISGLVWVGSSFVVNEHFRRRNVLRICVLWCWLQLVFGFCLWLVCVTMRLHRIQILAIKGLDQEQRCQRRAWMIFIPLFMTPAFVFCAAVTIKHLITFHHESHSCRYNKGWSTVLFVTLPPLYLLVALFFLYKLRGKTDLLLATEYRHTWEYVCMAIMIYMLSGVLYLTKGQYYVFGRCFLTFCVCSLVLFDFWLHMGWPVYLCLFRPESEMDRFEDRAGARVLSVLGSMRSRAVPPFNIPSSDGALLEAVEGAIAELGRFKAKIEELDKEKKELEAVKSQLMKELGLSVFSEQL